MYRGKCNSKEHEQDTIIIDIAGDLSGKKYDQRGSHPDRGVLREHAPLFVPSEDIGQQQQSS